MPADTWPTPARDTTQFPFVSSKVEIQPAHLRGFLALDGAPASDYAEQRKISGLDVDDQRLRTYRKMYERLGLIYSDSDKIELTDLGRMIAQLENSLKMESNELVSRVRKRAIDILSRYQLRNPDEEKNPVPETCDILPCICIWKAMLNLDNKLHHEELNRVLLRVMRMVDLDNAIHTIRKARQSLGKYEDRNQNDLDTQLGTQVQEDQPAARMAPWFSFAGWGGLIIEHQNRQDGFRHLVDNALPDVARAVAAPPRFYAAKNLEDWNRHYLWGSDITEMVAHFERDLENVGLRYSEELVKRFVASCLSKPFVILTGLTGSGKTKLAQAFAKWISPNHPLNLYSMLIPVGADWVGKENLLGYPDALDETKYVRTPLLEVLLHSVQEKDLPHFVILDEMNLSHVERYFAEFLSAVESGEPIRLYSCSDPDDPKHWRSNVPPVIERLPSNLVIVGTVNVDETTYMFSPKVLDRAHTIEFRMDKSEVTSFLTVPKSVNVDNLSGKGVSYGLSFVGWQREPTELSTVDLVELSKELQLFFDVLSAFESEFGFRVMNDIARFIHYYKKLSGNSWNIRSAIDAQIYQKILPKLNGSQRRLQPVLLALAILCYHQRDSGLSQKARQAASDPNLVDKVLDETAKELRPEEAYYPLSYAKVRRMLKRLTENGFTSFAEA